MGKEVNTDGGNVDSLVINQSYDARGATINHFVDLLDLLPRAWVVLLYKCRVVILLQYNLNTNKDTDIPFPIQICLLQMTSSVPLFILGGIQKMRFQRGGGGIISIVISKNECTCKRISWTTGHYNLMR